jgi:23S rRNA pseudouridine1911/1915/1917 synthase
MSAAAPERLELEVAAALAGERVDRAVALVASVSRAEAARLVDAGAVRLDGAVVVAGSARLRPGQVLAVEVSAEPVAARPSPPTLEVPVVWEDEHLCVVDKPAGLVVHDGAGVAPGPTLVASLVARCPSIADAGGEPGRPGIVHRLDKGTTGLLVVAKTSEAREALAEQFRCHEPDRRYLALVDGVVAEPAGVVDAPLGPSRTTRARRAVVVGGKPARTHYRRLGTSAWASLLECRLETGRTHQVRVHLAAIGHPLCGDVDYGWKRASWQASAEAPRRPLLHSWKLSLRHPSTGELLSWQAEPPEDFARATLAAGVVQSLSS